MKSKKPEPNTQTNQKPSSQTRQTRQIKQATSGPESDEVKASCSKGGGAKKRLGAKSISLFAFSLALSASLFSPVACGSGDGDSEGNENRAEADAGVDLNANSELLDPEAPGMEDTLEQGTKVVWRVLLDRKTNTASSARPIVDIDDSPKLPGKGSDQKSYEKRVKAFLLSYPSVFGATEESDLKFLEMVTNEADREEGEPLIRNFIFQQVSNGVEVEWSTLNLILGEDDGVHLVQGPFSKRAKHVGEKEAKISLEQAVKKVTELYAPDAQDKNDVESKKIVYTGDEDPKLAYRVTIYSASREVVIDAMTGDVLSDESTIRDVEVVKDKGKSYEGEMRGAVFKTESGHYCASRPKVKQKSGPYDYPEVNVTVKRGGIVNDAGDLVPGSWTEDRKCEVNAPDGGAGVLIESLPWMQSETNRDLRSPVDAYTNMIAVADYFVDMHGRSSYDNDAGPINVEVFVEPRIGSPIDGAYWNGSGMVFLAKGSNARPMAVDRSVVAHEFTHAIVRYTSKLEYKDQSGAINEALADIFGLFFKYNRARNDGARNDGPGDFEIGSLAVSGGLRHLADPKQDHRPGHLSEFLKTKADHGGVHTNSSLPALAWVYQTGGGKNSVSEITIPENEALGWVESEKLWWTTMVLKLWKKSKTTFSGLVEANIVAAKQRFGRGPEPDPKLIPKLKTVVCSWEAVGMLRIDGKDISKGSDAGDASDLNKTEPKVEEIAKQCQQGAKPLDSNEVASHENVCEGRPDATYCSEKEGEKRSYFDCVGGQKKNPGICLTSVCIVDDEKTKKGHCPAGLDGGTTSP